MAESILSIDGRWEGEYSYFPSEYLRIVPPRVRFVLVIRSSADGTFLGIVDEDPQLGCPEAATVSGQLKGNQISFTKQYPQLCCTDDRGSRSVKEFLATEHGMHVDQEFAAPPIQYTGIYDETQQIFSGTWHYPWTQIRFEFKGQHWEQEFAANTGSWRMHREYYIE